MRTISHAYHMSYSHSCECSRARRSLRHLRAVQGRLRPASATRFTPNTWLENVKSGSPQDTRGLKLPLNGAATVGASSASHSWKVRSRSQFGQLPSHEIRHNAL